MTEILIQILLVVAIVATILLIVVLWKWNGVLVDVKDTTVVVRKRAHDFDKWIGQTEDTIKDLVASFKSFLGAFEQLKNIKNKMTSFLEPDTNNSTSQDEPSKADKVKKAIDTVIEK